MSAAVFAALCVYNVWVCRHSITLSLQLLLFVHGETTWRHLASPADNHHERTDNTLLLYTRLAPSLSFHLHHSLSHTLLHSFTLLLYPLSTPLQSCHSLAAEISIAISYPVIYPVFHYSHPHFLCSALLSLNENLWSVHHIWAQFSGSFNFSLWQTHFHTHVTKAHTPIAAQSQLIRAWGPSLLMNLRVIKEPLDTGVSVSCF